MVASKHLWTVIIAFSLLALFSLLIPSGSGEPDWNQGTVWIEPDEGDRLTPSGSPVRSGEPGDELYFTIWIMNNHTAEQRVILSIADGPDWTIVVTGSVDVPPGEMVPADLYVAIPRSDIDPEAVYPIRVEANADVTGDRGYILVMVEPEVTIDHGLVMIPNNINELSVNVYPGQRTFLELKLDNKGNMYDGYDLSIGDHLTAWDIQFREGGTELQVSLGCVETENVYKTSIMVKVPSSAVIGQKVQVSISSLSASSELFGTGKRTDVVSISLIVTNGASINIRSQERGVVNCEEYIETSFIISHSGMADAALQPLISVRAEGVPLGNWEIMTAPPGPYFLSAGKEIEVSVRAVPQERTHGYFDLIFDGTSSMASVTPASIPAYFEPRMDIELGDLSGAPFDRGEEITIATTVRSLSDISQQAVIEVDGVPDAFLASVIPSHDIHLEPDEIKDIRIKLHPMDQTIVDPFVVNVSVKMPVDTEGLQWEKVDFSLIRVDFRELPDLEMKRIDMPIRTIDEGSMVCINVTVVNNGNIPVFNATIDINQITFGLSNPLITTLYLDLAPGEEKVLCIEWEARPAAKSIRARINAPEGQEEMLLDDNEMVEPVYVLPTKVDRDVGGSEKNEIPAVPAIAGGAGLVLVTAFLVFITSKDVFRYPFSLAIGPLYSKLRPEHILNNRLRKRIYVYVQNHPGEHFRSILTHLELTNGTLAHHLYTLEKENLIRSKRDGLYRRFYPAGYQIDESRVSLSAIQTRILELVLEEPGLSQKEISMRLKLSNSTVNYNIKSLADKGMIEVLKEGKSTSILPAEAKNS